jgi:methionyl-tRNA formyltransferase
MKKFLIISKKKYKKLRIKSFYYDYKINKKKIKKLNPNIIFFIFWSKKIEKKLFKNYTCIQFHTSDLPKFRGGSPIQNQIIKGIKKTKITAFKMNSKIDSGDICMKRNVHLNGNAEDIYKRIEIIALKMAIKIAKMKKINFIKQLGKVSYFKRRKPEDSNLELIKNSNLPKIYDFIRMLDADGYPKAFLKIGDKKIALNNAIMSKKSISGYFKIEKLKK